MSTLESSTLAPILRLYERGRVLEAYRESQKLGPLTDWRGAEARVLAGRLARLLGGDRLGTAIHLRAWREHPDHPEIRSYFARALAYRQGPLPAWRMLQKWDATGNESPEIQADLASLKAQVLTQLRDFDAAERYLEDALRVTRNDPWSLTIYALLRQEEDRYEDALSLAKKALAARPWFRPAVSAAAHLLQLTGRDLEALDLLRRALQHVESGDLVLQIANLEHELRRFREARMHLDKLPDLWPLMDDKLRKWLAGRRSDAAYFCGEVDEAVRLADESENPFFETMRDAHSSGESERETVLLDVQFVRQHHLTCGPATLTAISRFWSMPADHLEVADAICYDGSSHASQRRWAESHGWFVREFRMSWPSACALLDRGVPFCLTTVEAASSHLQAVVGYDTFRGSVFVRDPYFRELREFHAGRTAERYASVGPRAMVMVPASRASMLDGVELPDAALYDRHHEIECALQEHDRPRAWRAFDRMREAAPDHRLTFEARLSLARYDADLKGELESTEAIIAKYPDSVPWKLLRASRLAAYGRRQESLDLLRELSARRPVEPIALEQYGQALAEDARRLPDALGVLRAALRMLTSQASAYCVYANVLWSLGRRKEALDVYRFAVCLDDKDERLAASYFLATRHFHRAQEALDFLTQRFRRFHGKSSAPARTLVDSLLSLDRVPEAFDVLEEGLRLRPDDGALMLYAADVHTRYGNHDRAAELMEVAVGRCREASWLRTAARAAHFRAELDRSLSLWRKVLEVEPLAMDAHREVAARLEETEGHAAAIEHVQGALRRFDHHRQLQELLVQILQEDVPDLSIRAIQRLLDVDSDNAWAHRELALVLARERRFEEAFAELEEAQRIEPNVSSLYNVRGVVLKLAGRVEDARQAFRSAIGLDVDNGYALRELVGLADTPARVRDELTFFKREIESRVTFGPGLLQYLGLASEHLDSEEVLATSRDALAARPDLWQAWSAMCLQLLSMGRYDEAFRTAREGTKRFPLTASLWLDLARACEVRLDVEGQREALEKARSIQPSWSTPTQHLVDLLCREGKFEESRLLMEQAVARDPLDPVSHGFLADVLWRLGDSEGAIEHLERAVGLDPGYDWAWSMLRDCSVKAGRDDPTVAIARSLTQRRGGEARSWILLARSLGSPRLEEALDALDRANGLEPRNVDAHALRADLLSGAGRYNEALDACFPPVFGGGVPVVLQESAACVDAARGRVPEAIARMRETLEAAPGHAAGWLLLSQWYERLGDDEPAHSANLQLLRLRPHSPAVLARVGNSYRRQGDRAKAKEALSRSVELAPESEDRSAFGPLFELLLEDGEVDEAERVRDLCAPHLEEPLRIACDCALSARRGGTEEARAALRALFGHKEATRGHLDLAVSFVEGKVGDVSGPELEQSVLEERGGPAAVDLYVERCLDHGRWRKVLGVLGALDSDELWEAAADATLRGVAAHRRRRLLRKMVSRMEPRLRGSSDLWGMVAFALDALDLHKACVAWMRDWREREGVAPWMLENLTDSYVGLGRDREACDVSLHALSLPADHSRSMHEVWLLSHAVLTGEIEAARRHLDRVDRDSLAPMHALILELSEAVLSMERGPTGSWGYGEVRKKLRRALAGYPWFRKDRTLRRLARRFLISYARKRRTAGAWIWALIQVLRT